MSSTVQYIKVLFFGSIREAVGHSEIQVKMPTDQSLCTLLAEVMEQHGLKIPSSLSKSYLVALNKQIHRGDAVLHANDEVAILPPVTGG